MKYEFNNPLHHYRAVLHTCGRIKAAMKEMDITPNKFVKATPVDLFILLGKCQKELITARANAVQFKASLCAGCRDDFYNGKNPIGIKKCWYFDKARECKVGTEIKLKCWRQ
jgi:hypothetical protein